MALCLSLSYLFHCGVSPRHVCLIGVGVTELLSEFLSEALVLYVAVDLGCLWEEAISGLCFLAIFNQNLSGKLLKCVDCCMCTQGCVGLA